jgi:hypothetical protein
MEGKIGRMTEEISAIGGKVEQIGKGNFTPAMVDTVRKIVQPREDELLKRIEEIEGGKLPHGMAEAVKQIAQPAIPQLEEGDKVCLWTTCVFMFVRVCVQCLLCVVCNT